MKLAMMSDLDFDKNALQAALDSQVAAVDDVFHVAAEEMEEKIKAVPRPDSKLFSCELCQQTFDFTPIEALKHKRMCKRD